MQVFVKTLANKVLTVEIESGGGMTPGADPASIQSYKGTTILQVKEQIFDKEGIQPAEQQLVFAGKQLEDGRCAHEYGISAESTIHMVARG